MNIEIFYKFFLTTQGKISASCLSVRSVWQLNRISLLVKSTLSLWSRPVARSRTCLILHQDFHICQCWIKSNEGLLYIIGRGRQLYHFYISHYNPQSSPINLMGFVWDQISNFQIIIQVNKQTLTVIKRSFLR